MRTFPMRHPLGGLVQCVYADASAAAVLLSLLSPLSVPHRGVERLYPRSTGAGRMVIIATLYLYTYGQVANPCMYNKHVPAGIAMS